MRARGNSLRCLSVEISFIRDSDILQMPCVSKNRPLAFVFRYVRVYFLSTHGLHGVNRFKQNSISHLLQFSL
jgi:hypothetical protein